MFTLDTTVLWVCLPSGHRCVPGDQLMYDNQPTNESINQGTGVSMHHCVVKYRVYLFCRIGPLGVVIAMREEPLTCVLYTDVHG